MVRWTSLRSRVRLDIGSPSSHRYFTLNSKRLSISQPLESSPRVMRSSVHICWLMKIPLAIFMNDKIKKIVHNNYVLIHDDILVSSHEVIGVSEIQNIL